VRCRVQSVLFCFPAVACFFFFQTTAHAQVEIDSSDYFNQQPVFRSLKKALRNPNKVYKLDLKSSSLKEFPVEILKLKNLRTLFLDSNQIEILPVQLDQLQNLRTLSLSYNKIHEIPAAMGNLQNLLNLFLDYNAVSVFPREFFFLRGLRVLYINNNAVTEFSPSFRNLQELHTFIASGNHIRVIPNEIGHLYNLTKLSLADNPIESLPETFFELHNLQQLYLSGTLLKVIGPEINSFKNLEVLALHRNHLTALPPEIGELYELKKLFLDSNLLERLPAELGDLINLKVLDIGSNPLKTMPLELSHIKKLEKIYVNGINFNPFPQVLYDLQNNGVKLVGFKGKEVFNAQLLLSKARNAKLTGDTVNSILKYEEFVRTDTNYVPAMAELAELYLDKMEFDKAAELCKRAMVKDAAPDLMTAVRRTYSSSLNRTSTTEQIIADYRLKIKADSASADPYFELGKYYYNQGDYNAARKVFEQAIRIDPRHIYSHFYLSVLNVISDRIPSLVFSSLRFLTLQPGSRKAETLRPYVWKDMKMYTGVKNKKGGSSYYDTYIIKDENGEIIYQRKESGIDLMVAMLSDLLKTDKMTFDSTVKDTTSMKELVGKILHKNENNVEIFQSELTRICTSTTDSVKMKDSFAWTYYYPYFNELISKGYLETFSYLINSGRREEDYIVKWMKNNPAKIEEFKAWDRKYVWNE